MDAEASTASQRKSPPTGPSQRSEELIDLGGSGHGSDEDDADSQVDDVAALGKLSEFL
jgi:hypothetical protein